MTHILTLIAEGSNLSIAHLEMLEKFIAANGVGENGRPEWLDMHKAADIPVQNCVTMEQMQELRALFAGDRIDILCTHTQNRKKKLLLADMDSTIVTTETLDELAGKAGIKDQIAGITARAMNGELDFEAALRERVGLLKGLSESVIESVWRDRITFMPGGKALLATMKANGAYAALVSGGFTAFTGRVAAALGFDENRANTLLAEGGRLSGAVADPILGKQAKLDAPAETLKQKCAASTAHREQAFPAAAMKSAFIECANGISDLVDQTQVSPDLDHYQLLVAPVLCMNKDKSCASLERGLKNYQ